MCTRALAVAILSMVLFGCGRPMGAADPANPSNGAEDNSAIEDPGPAMVLVKNWDLSWLWNAAQDGGTLTPDASIQQSDGGYIKKGTLAPNDKDRFVRFSLPDLSADGEISFFVSTDFSRPPRGPETPVACLVADGPSGRPNGSCLLGGDPPGDYLYVRINRSHHPTWWSQAKNLIITTQSNWKHSQDQSSPAETESIDFTVEYAYSP
jgi:hypothetical protein